MKITQYNRNSLLRGIRRRIPNEDSIAAELSDELNKAALHLFPDIIQAAWSDPEARRYLLLDGWFSERGVRIPALLPIHRAKVEGRPDLSWNDFVRQLQGEEAARIKELLDRAGDVREARRRLVADIDATLQRCRTTDAVREALPEEFHDIVDALEEEHGKRLPAREVSETLAKLREATAEKTETQEDG